MKPVSFLRNTWRKKDKSAKGLVSESPTIEQALFEVSSAPALSEAGSETTSISSLQFDSTSQSNLTKTAFLDGPASRVSEQPQTVPRLSGRHGAPFNISHGPPRNTSHGPPSLNLRHPDVALGNRSPNIDTPRRPPRPPSLNLPDKPFSPMPRSRNHVKFAPEPQTRSSPLGTLERRPALRRNSYTTQGNLSLDDAVDAIFGGNLNDSSDSQPSESSSSDKESSSTMQTSDHSTNLQYPCRDQHMSIARSTNAVPRSSFVSPKDSSMAAHAILDLDDSLNSDIKSVHRASSSTPHLPLDKGRPSSSDSNFRPLRRNLRPHTSSEYTLGLFPSPPPLVIRRRPKPLVLLPTPTIAQLPSSPLLSSNDSTPVATPTTPRPPISPCSQDPRSTKFISRGPGRPVDSIPPPTYSPPNSPLPTPPMAQSRMEPERRRILRTTQSTSELRDYVPESRQPAHRSTSSVPVSDLYPNIDAVRKRIKSRPEVCVPIPEHTTYVKTSRKQALISEPSTDAHVHWGYAV